MDRWKRSSRGVLLNDDSVGYQNAKNRVLRRAERTSEMDEIRAKIAELEEKVAVALKSSESTAKAVSEIVALLRERLG